MQRAADGALTIVFTAVGQWLPRVQAADAMGDARIKTRRLSTPKATGRWTFRPIEERIAEHPWQGLAMRIELDCPGHPIHWLIEDTAWELGGEAAGGTLIQRNVSTIDLEQRVTRNGSFSIIEKFFTEVRRRIHRAYGFRPEVPRPYIHAHLWDHDLKRLGPGWIEPLRDALPDCGRLGYRQVFTHGVWESVTSDDRPGIEGNICRPYAFRFAEQFGGAAGMKRLADRAHELGLALFQWFGFQFSKFAPLWQEHPDWLLREANGDPWDGAYQILWCGRMWGKFGKQLLAEVAQVKRDTGLDGIFWDSYQNLGVTCVDWQAPGVGAPLLRQRSGGVRS